MLAAMMCAVCPVDASFAAGPSNAGPWPVQRVGLNLYKIERPLFFVRTENCEERPDSGIAMLQIAPDSSILRFSELQIDCKVRDFLRPTSFYNAPRGDVLIRLTVDLQGWYQLQGWNRVSNGDVYLNTRGCFARGSTEYAFVSVNRDGTGQIRYSDGRGCTIVGTYQRVDAPSSK
jgi:hypothetical protein